MKLLYQFSLFFFLASCVAESPDEYLVSIDIDDFEEINLSSEKHVFEEIINPSSFLHQGDKILIGEYQNVPDEYPRFHIINTKDWTYDKPKWRPKLDRSVFYISINEQTNEIYGQTADEDPGIAVFQLPEELL